MRPASLRQPRRTSRNELNDDDAVSAIIALLRRRPRMISQAIAAARSNGGSSAASEQRAAPISGVIAPCSSATRPSAKPLQTISSSTSRLLFATPRPSRCSKSNYSHHAREHPDDEPFSCVGRGCSTGEEAYSIAILLLDAVAACGGQSGCRYSPLMPMRTRSHRHGRALPCISARKAAAGASSAVFRASRDAYRSSLN